MVKYCVDTKISDMEVSVAGYIVNKDKCSDRCMHNLDQS